MNLREWNERLAEHFSALARDRRDIPVFALEHGLVQAELLVLQRLLRAHIRATPPDHDHKLAWVVYAAEIGYGYAGNEYWQTFEEKTPGWTLKDRDWLRDAFVSFQRMFSGARPSGRWAEQFSIIAWPITHAILPRDLQQQLARILYELRHSFSAELFDEPKRLGEFIAARSWNASERFRNFVQAPALVGQIAAALLLQGKEGFKTLIHDSTLKRIGDDLDRERRGREWLRSARRAAEERAKIRGLTICRPRETRFQRWEKARAEVERLGIEPRLVLRPIEASRWEVALEIPDFSHLLLRFPELRDVLTESRCIVAGAAGRPLARGRCLHGPQRVPLSRWPESDEVLLKFERENAQLEYLLKTECMLRPGTSRLFRIASDGLAYECRGMRVRADSTYVIASTEPLPRSSIAPSVELACPGVNAVLLDFPAAPTSEWEQLLKQFQLKPAKSIEVWPAGLGAVAWDDEGYGEWFASEKPILAIRSDHEIHQLTIAMLGGPLLSIPRADTRTGEPIFIELPPLAVGLHEFSVAARGKDTAGSELIGELDVVMRVRDARPWSPGVAAGGLFEVELDPLVPSLEQLWEDRVDVTIRGPIGRGIECSLSLFERVGEASILDIQLPSLPSPVCPTQWRAYFEQHARNNKHVQGLYDRAQLCRLVFSAGEFGVFTVDCERQFEPLRWVLRQQGDSVCTRLIDDSGAPGEPEILFFSFEDPAKCVRLSLMEEYPVEAPGGLFVACRNAVTVGLLAVPTTMRSFADLGVTPKIAASEHSVEAVLEALEYARLWEMARSSGHILSSHRRRSVLQAFAGHIISLLGGQQWARAESAFVSNANTDTSVLMDAVSSRPDLRGIASVLSRDAARLATSELESRIQCLVDLLRAFRVPLPRDPREARKLTELALRIASRPGHPAILEEGKDLKQAIQFLLEEIPILPRAARFFVIATDQYLGSRTEASEVYAGWRWSA